MFYIECKNKFIWTSLVTICSSIINYDFFKNNNKLFITGIKKSTIMLNERLSEDKTFQK